MGRPRISDQTIVMSANGKGVVWDATVGFVGDSQLTQRAKTAAMWEMEVVVHPMLPSMVATDDTPEGAFAALTWACGGRGVVVSAPAEVYALLDQAPVEDEDLCPDGQIEVLPEFVEEA